MTEEEVLIPEVIAHHRRVQAKMREQFDSLLFYAIDLYDQRDKYARMAGEKLPPDYARLRRFLMCRVYQAMKDDESALRALSGQDI
jgi:hypothetical protein